MNVKIKANKTFQGVSDTNIDTIIMTELQAA